jgi:hypothetical protein
MKKILFISIVIFSSTYAYGQLNPIKNLQFTHIYQTPYNCFSLWWTEPDTSLLDTLVGYNIYRDANLYLFTTNTGIHWEPCMGNPDTTYQGFMQYNLGMFSTHVTAVYNVAHVESPYNDSVFFGGIMIGKDDYIKLDDLHIYPNPFNFSTIITLPQTYYNITLAVYDIQGKLVTQNQYTDCSQVQFNRNQLSNGLYFLKLTLDDKEVETGKIVISE